MAQLDWKIFHWDENDFDSTIEENCPRKKKRIVKTVRKFEEHLD